MSILCDCSEVGVPASGFTSDHFLTRIWNSRIAGLSCSISEATSSGLTATPSGPVDTGPVDTGPVDEEEPSTTVEPVDEEEPSTTAEAAAMFFCSCFTSFKSFTKFGIWLSNDT